MSLSYEDAWTTNSAEEIRHPEIEVELVGEDGNAFFILGKVNRALHDAGLGSEEIQQFRDEAQAGDYDHLLAVVQLWVTVL